MMGMESTILVLFPIDNSVLMSKLMYYDVLCILQGEGTVVLALVREVRARTK